VPFFLFPAVYTALSERIARKMLSIWPSTGFLRTSSPLRAERFPLRERPQHRETPQGVFFTFLRPEDGRLRRENVRAGRNKIFTYSKWTGFGGAW